MEINYAEKNGPYIFDALRRLSESGPLKTYDYDYKETLPDKPGIYMFYIFSDNTENRYPVYFGKTEASLRARIGSHKNDGGVIKRYGKKDQFPTVLHEKERDLLLRFTVVPLSNPFTIRLAESLFLCAFNFALNKMENGKERLEINGMAQIDHTDPNYEKNMREAVKKMREGASILENALK